MQFWNSASESTGYFLIVLFLAAVLLPATVTTAVSGPDTWSWEPWLTTGAGHENDLVLDPDFNRTLVPGGTFLDGVAGFRLGRSLGRITKFRLLSRNSLERFLNNEGRTLLASNMLGDLRLGKDSSWQGRLTLNGDYFNDSGSASFRRLGGGLESGLGFRQQRWRAELSAFYQGRRYPNVQVTTSDQQEATYTEGQLGGGLLLGWTPLGGTYLRVHLTGKSTSAADPAFDSTSWTASGSLDRRLGATAWLSVAYTRQTRTFDNRTPDLDHDTYDRIGLGLSRQVSPQVRLDGRYAYATYTYPQGGTQNTTRISLAATFLWGGSANTGTGRSHPILPVLSPSATAQDPVLFRFFAPQATRVAVVGDFNGWRSTALPLVKNPDGWWEVRLHLAPGTYQYAYFVDGEIMTPTDAAGTTADGFGGVNGILVISDQGR